MRNLSPDQTKLLTAAVTELRGSPPQLPNVSDFRVQHADLRSAIDELERDGLLARVNGHYMPTIEGLRSLGTDAALEVIRESNLLLDWLKDSVKNQPQQVNWSPQSLAPGAPVQEQRVPLLLTLLVFGMPSISAGHQSGGNSPYVYSVNVSLDGVLDAQPFPERTRPEFEARGKPRLTRLYVHNFRTLVNFEWKPPRATVLVGENGAGKTSLVEVLWLLQAVVVKGAPIHETVCVNARTVWLAGQASEQVFELDFEQDREVFRYRLIVVDGPGAPSILEELTGSTGLLYRAKDGVAQLFGDDPSAAARATIPFDRRRSFIAVLEPRDDNRRIVAFRNAVDSIWAFKPDAARLGGVALEEATHLSADLSDFAAWYRTMVPERPVEVGELHADLRKVLPGFEVLRFESVSRSAKRLVVAFKFTERYELDWTELSDGQRVLIALYGLLRLGLPAASLIVIDEAENYVAPTEIQPWLYELGDAANQAEQQLIVVSHHPETINYLAADAAFRMWRDPTAGHSRIAALEPDLDVGETAYDAFKGLDGAGEP